MTLRRGLACVLVLGAVLLSPQALAQSAPRLDIERFVPAVAPDGFLTVQATRTEGPGRYTLQLSANYQAVPLTLDDANYDLRKINSRLATWLGGEVGIGGRAAVGALLPFFPYQNARVGKPISGAEVLDAALGDVRLHARYRLIGENSTEADAPKDGPGLAFELRSGLPTHTGGAVAGERGVRAELHVLADFQLLGAGVGADLGVRHRFVGTEIDRLRMPSAGMLVPDPIEFDDELLFGAAIKMPLPPVPEIVLLLELHGAADFRSAEATALELDLGARTAVGSFTFNLGGGLGLSDGAGVPDGRVMVGVAFTPVESDQDKDGIDDDRDQCPFLGEDLDGYMDRDGCPDPDNDNDLIPDLDDLCPSDSAEEGKDENEDGCTDGTEPKTRR